MCVGGKGESLTTYGEECRFPKRIDSTSYNPTFWGVRSNLRDVERFDNIGFDGLCEVFEAVQEFIERHAVFVVDLGGRERFAEPVVHDAILMRVEVSDLQNLLYLLYARRIEDVQGLYRLVVRDEAFDAPAL